MFHNKQVFSHLFFKYAIFGTKKKRRAETPRFFLAAQFHCQKASGMAFGALDKRFGCAAT